MSFSHQFGNEKDGWGGIRTPCENTEKSESQSISGAKSGALIGNIDLPRVPADHNSDLHSAPNTLATLDADLEAIVEVWPRLPQAIRAAIFAIVR
jgi:hypothetical protein